MGFRPWGLWDEEGFPIVACGSPEAYPAQSLTRLAVVAGITWLTQAQELGNAVLALATVQAGLGQALINLCGHLGRRETRRET